MRDRWKEEDRHSKLPKYLEKDHVDQEMHKIKHWIPDTTASISSSKNPLTDAECAIPRLRLWSISYLDVKH